MILISSQDSVRLQMATFKTFHTNFYLEVKEESCYELI